MLENRFKITIGEMSYKLKTKEFTLAMQLLAGMVQLETDLDVINVSAMEFKATVPLHSNQLSLHRYT